jgi:tetratricopeptide (TPR) repeat protein
VEGNIHYNRAQVLIGQNRYREAERELFQALTENPEDADVLNDISICRAAEGDYPQAIEYVQKAIALEPDNPNFLYSYSRILFLTDDLKNAQAKIDQAISVHPYNAEYFNLAGLIAFHNNDYKKALSYANAGLEAEADNINCLNLRSQSLVKLNRKEEAFSTIEDALHFDPENAYTHANLGWSTLEKGKATDALEHFRNSLRLDPNNEWAKSGMIEAMKGRYWIYKLFLQYTFWMQKHGSNFQWGFVLGFYVLSKILRSLYPPLIFLFLIIATLSWVMYPLSNLFLRLNKYGRYALSKKDTLVSNLVGGSLLVCAIGGVLFLAQWQLWAAGLAYYGFSMMIPLASMLNPRHLNHRKILVSYAVIMGLVGLAAVVSLFINESEVSLGVIYLVGIFVYQWVANYFIGR